MSRGGGEVRSLLVLALVAGLGSVGPEARAERADPAPSEEPEPSLGDRAFDEVAGLGAHPPRGSEEHTTIVVASRPVADDQTADAVELDGETLRRSARASTLEAIAQEAPDLYVTSRGLGVHGVASGGSGAIAVRGLGGGPNTQILVVEDGVPDYQGIFGHPIPDAYVPGLVAATTLVKGGDSVLYGSNALGGVVLIESKVPRLDGLEVRADSAYGSFQTLRERVSLLARRDGWDLASALSVLRTDGHRLGAGGTNVVGHAAVGFRPTPRLRIVLRDRVAHLEGEDPGPATHPNDGHWYDVWRNTASLGLDYRHGRLLRLEGVGFLNLGVHRLHDGFYSEDYLFGGRATAHVRPHETVRLVVGLGAEGVAGEVLDRTGAEAFEVRGVASVYAYEQLEWRPRPWLRIVGGARELLSSRSGFVFLYKGGLRIVLPSGLSIRARVSRSYREPTIRELYLPFPTANPDLRPELALNVDVGLQLHAGPFEISVSAYRTWADDLIRYFGAWPSAEVVNIDHVEVWGLEAHARILEHGPLRLFVGGAWQDVGRYTRQNPSAKTNFSIEAAHRFGRHSVSGALSGEWVRGLYQENYSRDPVGDVFFLDLALRYGHRIGGGLELEPYLLVRNLTNARNEYVRGYPMPGINVLAGLVVSYASPRAEGVDHGTR